MTTTILFLALIAMAVYIAYLIVTILGLKETIEYVRNDVKFEKDINESFNKIIPEMQKQIDFYHNLNKLNLVEVRKLKEENNALREQLCPTTKPVNKSKSNKKNK